MDSVEEVLSKFKNSLEKVINNCKDSISDIEKEEEFIQNLGDLVNYSKSDCLLLPFYDETMLSRIFEKIFPLSTTEMNKIKTAKYLIEASKTVDKENFQQYNDAVKELEKINSKIEKNYEKLISDDKIKTDKETYTKKLSDYTSILNTVGKDEFTGLIQDIDAFEETINESDLTEEEVNAMLNVAITCNLKYLDSNGVVVSDNAEIQTLKEDNNKMQEEIQNLSNLLGAE